VREQLERILLHREFQGSERTRRFLRYVVEEALAGRGERIKAFTVAMAAFDRDETFNAQSDPIVRIEAGRLRRCLERYYLVAGAADSVRVEIPKGTYVPVFSWTDAEASGAPADATAAAERETRGQPPTTSPARLPVRAPLTLLAIFLVAGVLAGVAAVLLGWSPGEEAPEANSRPPLPQPSIAILPFGVTGAHPTDANLSAGMTNEIVRGISQHSGLLVLGPRSLQRLGAAPDVTVVGSVAGAAFVLAGDIQHAQEKIRVAVELSETKTGSVIWAETFDRNFNVEVIFDLQAEIGREIVRKIVQPQGAIALFDWKRTRGMAPETWEAYDCVVQAEQLHQRGELALQAVDVRACLKRAVEQEPGYADPWIMLALLEVDAVRFTPQTLTSPADLDPAYAAAQRGVDLAPDSGRAHLAMMMALFFRGEVERALAVGNIALRLSPQDPDVVGEVGLRQVMSGDTSAGIKLLERAAGFYDETPPSLRLAMSLGYLRAGLSQKASDIIAEVVPSANFAYWGVAAAVHGKAGRLVHAQQAADALLKLYPDFTTWAAKEVEQRHIAPDLAAAMMEGWRTAGLPVRPTHAADVNP
jgi:TolB-like protein